MRSLEFSREVEQQARGVFAYVGAHACASGEVETVVDGGIDEGFLFAVGYDEEGFAAIGFEELGAALEQLGEGEAHASAGDLSGAVGGG